jgi:hypothetical protein
MKIISPASACLLLICGPTCGATGLNSKRMNAAIELLDTMIDRGFVERPLGFSA